MTVRQDTDGSLLDAVVAAPRALVFLTVPWSGPERDARRSFRDAAERLAADHPGLAVECFALDEDSAWCQAWLASLRVPQLGGGHPLGAGSVVWLEHGRAVSSEVGGAALAPGGIVARCVWQWGTLPCSHAVGAPPTPHELFTAVLRDTGDRVAAIRAVRERFGLDLRQVKEVMLQAEDWAASLDEHEERLAAELERWAADGGGAAGRPPGDTANPG